MFQSESARIFRRPRGRWPWLAALAVAAAVAAGQPAAGQTPTGQSVKMGVIDVEKILTESASGKVVIATLEQFQKQKASELEAQKARYTELRGRFTEGRLSLAEDKLAEMQKQLEDLETELRRSTEDAQREFQKKQETAFGEVERKVMPIIAQVGEELGYTMIFNKFQSGLVYADDSLDITGEVIKRFDSQPAN